MTIADNYLGKKTLKPEIMEKYEIIDRADLYKKSALSIISILYFFLF